MQFAASWRAECGCTKEVPGEYLMYLLYKHHLALHAGQTCKVSHINIEDDGQVEMTSQQGCSPVAVMRCDATLHSMVPS